MAFFKRLHTIQGSLLLHELSFVLLIMVTSGISISWAVSWQSNSQEAQRLTAMTTQLQMMRGHLYRQLKEVFDATFLNDQFAEAEYNQQSRYIEDVINELQMLIEDKFERAQVNRIALAYDRFHDETSYYLRSDNVTEQQLFLLDRPLEQLTFREIETAFGDFERFLRDKRTDLTNAQQRWLSKIVWLISIAVLISLALLILSRWFVQRNVLTPLRAVIEGAGMISQGKFDLNIKRQGVEDLNVLADAINSMAVELLANRDTLIETRKQAALGELVPLVAHNIRNPLAGIRAAAQVTLDDDIPADTRESLRDIIVAVDRLERWVTSLLMYLHPINAQFVAEKLTSVIDNAVSLIQLQLEDKQLSLVRRGWQISAKPIQMDVNLMEQTLCNLVQNAIEAAPEGSQIMLTYWQAEDEVGLAIEDQGRGIDTKKVLDQSIADNTQLHYGLGIPFSKKVVQQHGGHMEHQTLAEGGTKVILRFPLGSVS